MMRWPIQRFSREAAWANVSERGSDLGLRFAVWSIRRLGEAPVKLLLGPIALYYCAFAPVARRASRLYLEQLDRFRGNPVRRVGLRDFYRHIYSFADVLLDRFAIWSGNSERFDIQLHGREHMLRVINEQRGGFLIGAHLGSFEILRLIAREADIPVNVIMYTGNAEKVNAALEALDPECKVRVIDIDPASARTAFDIRSCVSRGEFVAILADRVTVGGRTARISQANFLGRPAGFSQGPFLVAMALRLPMIFTVALKTGPYSYDVFFETLATGEPVRAVDRARVVQQRIELFASRLEEYCQRAPLQWFNFYDFWADAKAAIESELESEGDPDEPR